MEWKINEDRPIWVQLSEQLAARIGAGVYAPGERLSSVREFAASAGVNPNTMQRALADLEAKGLVETERTAGRSVTQDAARIQALRRQLARERTAAFIESMEALGYTRQEIRQTLEEILDETAGAGRSEKQSEK